MTLPGFILEFDSPDRRGHTWIIEFLQGLPSETVIDVDGVVILLNGCNYEGDIAGWYYDPEGLQLKGSELHKIANLSDTRKIRIL